MTVVYVGARFGRAEAGSRPVFLEKLNCIMSDHSLLDCQSYSANEPSSCDHSQDISIQCTGITISKALKLRLTEYNMQHNIYG